MRRIVLRLLLAAAGLGGGAASALDPNPSLVVISDPAAQHVVTAPAFAPRSVPNLAGPPAGAVAGGVALAGGCSTCGPKGHGLGGLAIGAGCENPVTCGNCATEKTFLFGSCRQFYSPGRDCGGHGRGGHAWHGLKNPLLYGTAGLGVHDTCEYGSYNLR
jgi:hypothetical protein